MIKLGICVSYFDDIECLKSLIISIFPIPVEYKQNIVFIGIDGKYRGYDQEGSAGSKDGSYELIEWLRKQNKIEVINTTTPVTFNERDKRQKYIDVAADRGLTFCLILDSDESLKVNWKAFFEEELTKIVESNYTNNIYTVKCTDLDIDGKGGWYVGYRPRLWYKPELMHYTTRHSLFESKIPMKGPRRAVSDNVIEIYHSQTQCRSSDRISKQKDYELQLEALESGS